MVSFLIPNYNYDARPLLHDLHKKCSAIKGMKWEIIFYEDGSEKEWVDINSVFFETNKVCKYLVGTKNLGAAYARNILAKNASYPWLYFLDSDVQLPQGFINKLKPYTQSSATLFVGGIRYIKKSSFRSRVGSLAEVASYDSRKKNPANTLRGANFMVHSSIIKKTPLPSLPETYGLEDTLWAAKLHHSGTSLRAMDICVAHLDVGNVELLVSRQESITRNLIFIGQEYPELFHYFKILRIRHTYKFIYNSSWFKWFSRTFSPPLRFLILKLPNPYLLQLYKLFLLREQE